MTIIQIKFTSKCLKTSASARVFFHLNIFQQQLTINTDTNTEPRHPVRTRVLKVRRITHKQHVCVGRVRDADEASLVLQRRRDANAGSVGVRGAVGFAATHSRPRHHLTHRHTGVLRPQRERRNHKQEGVYSFKRWLPSFLPSCPSISLFLDGLRYLVFVFTSLFMINHF